MADVSISKLFKQTVETIEKVAKRTLPLLPQENNEELKTDTFVPNLSPPSKAQPPSAPKNPRLSDFDIGTGGSNP